MLVLQLQDKSWYRFPSVQDMDADITLLASGAPSGELTTSGPILVRIGAVNKEDEIVRLTFLKTQITLRQKQINQILSRTAADVTPNSTAEAVLKPKAAKAVADKRSMPVVDQEVVESNPLGKQALDMVRIASAGASAGVRYHKGNSDLYKFKLREMAKASLWIDTRITFINVNY